MKATEKIIKEHHECSCGHNMVEDREIRAGKPADEKTKQLVLYIADRLKDQPGYGATLLNKVLYYVDTVSDLEDGKAISIFSYVRQDYGPIPKPSEYFEMPLSSPDVAIFTKEEIVLIERIISTFKESA